MPAKRIQRTPTAGESLKAGDTFAAPLEQLALGLAGLGWMLRWLTITEAANAGETLWVALLWFLAATLFCWSDFRNLPSAGETDGDFSGQERQVLEVDLLSAGVMLITVGHVVGCIWLYFYGGQLRFALNLSWEWIGLLVSFLILRRIVRNLEWRRDLFAILLASAVPFAFVGLWQHYVWYEQSSQEYRSQKEVYLELEGTDPTVWNEQERKDYSEAINYFQQQEIPLGSESLQSWENRLLASREPLGFFALTNSFAALLLFLLGVWLALANFMTNDQSKRLKTGKWQCLGWLIATGTIFYVLLLTKSRSAWAAFIITAAMFCLFYWTRRAFRGLLYGGAGLLCLTVFAWLSGAIDTEVFSEAPRSLQYRFIYWTTTWELLQDSLFFGTGPGNFRTSYLQYRPEGASEEVADPHQFLLDLWANGGLLALLGIAFIVFYLIKSGRQNAVSVQNIPTSDSSFPLGSGLSHSIITGGLAAFPLVGAMHWLNLSGLEWALFAAGVGASICLLLLSRFALPFVNQVTLFAPRLAPWLLVALLIHLCASGGIEMPGIVQMLLLLLALIPSTATFGSFSISRRTSSAVGASSGVVLMGLLYWTSWLPVQQAAWNLELAEQARLDNANGQDIQALFNQAVHADPLDPQPSKRQGDFLLSTALGRTLGGGNESTLVDLSIESYKESLKRDPRNARRFIDVGRAYEERYRRTNEKEAGNQAVSWYQKGIDRYPTHPGLRAQFGLLLEETGQMVEARDQAREALRLDELNNQAGHTDQRLDSGTQERLKHVIETSSE
ncbi:O-Antigen ligase [Polystyrenella longa]|uniref:O-Antigen ligase n=1 Tax=Polystyrenella longa TaxID=2528007 RepID=A0A518CL21_9PLAN|nr:O-antigen ligase family protein [Polystyrenella longa]QDU79923.1 O-Antigen ligase [Polystyrenella longa]